MIKVNIKEASSHLSRYVDGLRDGDSILLCKRNQPVAEIRPVSTLSGEPRPIGLGKDVFQVPDSFFEELPDDVVAMFNGE
ncbi:MAG: type II toxin-antitoxin system Phd/YefM family antitoxin [Nitrospirae bacterium]|nr:type II toxin-antitoxin system Phd/YefM family antitoxin [Nitrospirota bacterium]